MESLRTRARRVALQRLGAVAVAGLWPAAARAQESFPSRTVRLLVGYAPGGGVDTLARAVAPVLAEQLGQSVIVENRPGASGTVAAGELTRAPADGHTLFFAETGTMVAPSLNPRIGLDPASAFSAVAGVGSIGMALVASPQQPFASVDELVRQLKARPAQYSYGSPGVGTIQHLAMELFKQRAGVFCLHIPYRGAAAILPDVIGNTIQVGVVSTGPAIVQHRAGRVRMLAVTTVERLPSVPEVPTLAASYPGLEGSARFWVVGPRGLPAPVVQRLGEAVRVAMASPRVLEAFAAQGGTAAFLPAARAAEEIGTEAAKWAQVIRTAGIKGE